MPQVIEVPELGLLEFPDGMTDAEMASAIDEEYSRSRPQLQPGDLAGEEARQLPDLTTTIQGGGRIPVAGVKETISEPLSQAQETIASVPEFPHRLMTAADYAAAAAMNIPAAMYREATGVTPQVARIRRNDVGQEELISEDAPLPFQAGKPLIEFEKTVLQPEGNPIERLVEGFTTPGMLASFPFAAAKPVQLAFLSQTVPGAVNAAMELVGPETPPERRKEAATEALLNGVMSYGIARHLLKPAGGQYAEAIREDTGQLPQAGQVGERVEAPRGYDVEQAAPVKPEPVAERVGERPQTEVLPPEQPSEIKAQVPSEVLTKERLKSEFEKLQEPSPEIQPEPGTPPLAQPTPLVGEQKPAAAPEIVKPSVASKEFDRLVLEHGPELGWVKNLERVYDPMLEAKTHGGTAQIKAKILRSKEIQLARRAAARDAGIDISDLNTIEGRAKSLEKLKTFLVQREAPKKQATEFASATAKGKTEVAADDLKMGDVLDIEGEKVPVTNVDAEGNVTLEDGTRFGRQTLASGDKIYVEEIQEAASSAEFTPTVKPSAASKEFDRLVLPELAKPAPEIMPLRAKLFGMVGNSMNDFLNRAPREMIQDAYATASELLRLVEGEIATRKHFGGNEKELFPLRYDVDHIRAVTENALMTSAATPKLRPGEKGTGDLLQGEDAPFNLAGEKATDFERIATEKSAQEKAKREAAELQSKQQSELVGMGGPSLSRSGPGAASPAEFAQRQSSANRTPPPPNPPVAIEPGQSPSAEVVRANKDYNLFNRINSPQWLYYFGRLGQSAKAAWETMVLGEFKMRESVKRDVKQFVEDTLKSLPRPFRKDGGKAMFDVLDGKTMEQIESDWRGRPEGEQVIAQAQKVKTRLEEIRTNIRDIKRDSFRKYLVGADKATLENLFRENINRDTDTSRMTKEQMSDALALEQFPDDWGIADGSYLPHLFFGQWKVSARLPGAENPQFITRAQTIQEAKARIYEQTQANPELRNAQFNISQDTIIPADMIRLGDRRFWHLVGEMKERNMSEADVRDALRGNIGRKAAKQKWFGSLQERKGAAGYSQEFSRVMGAYLSGFHRWRVLTEVNRQVQPLIEQVRREGRVNAAENLEHLADNLWGKPSKTTKEFDAAVRQVPVLRDYIKPLALDRWSRFARNLTGLLTLRTVRFALVNRLQPLQGLYPIIGERGLVQAKIMQHSAEGRRLLDEAGVTFDPGQYSTPGAPFGRTREILERLSGERTNQEVAFLGMYNHARNLGLGHAEAVNYGKLRGQLMTQFTPLITDSPALFEGPIGQVMFQFKRFPVKQIELMAKVASDKNVPAMIRMLGTFGLLGGLSFYLRQTWFSDNDTRLKLKRSLDKEYGTKVADAIMYGLPGFAGADISGSITLGDEPIGSNIYEKAARALTGPAVSLGIETAKAATAETRTQRGPQEKAEALLRRFPALKPLAEASAMIRGDVDLLTPDGEIKLRRKLADAIAGLGSFRSANEANVSLAVNGIMALRKQESQLQNALYVAVQSGDKAAKQEALKAIDDFNAQWPEARITVQDRNRYLANRKSRETKTDAERVAGKRHLKLLPASQTSK